MKRPGGDRGAGTDASREDRSGASSAEEDLFFVLLVEDTLEDALLIRSLLADELDHRVTLVRDGIRGCQLARHRRWNLVITELNLPGRNGSEVIQASREARPDTPVLAITAHSDKGEKALQSGAEEIVHKPLDRAEIRSVVLSVLREVGGRRPSSRTGGVERRILAVGGLPGDAELGCGGILLGRRKLGHPITLLVLSAGERAEAVEARRDEAERAAGALGAELILPDTFGNRIPLQKKAAEWVEEAA